jgi:hypothetical protein
MAHFAKLDENEIVTAVLVVNNESLNPENEEESGILFLQDLFQDQANWKQTSYNASFRYNFAGIGYKYDPIDDAFIAPMPRCGHDELILNNLKRWECVSCDDAIAKRLASVEE